MQPTTYRLGSANAPPDQPGHAAAVAAARAVSFEGSGPVNRAGDVLFVPVAAGTVVPSITLKGMAKTAALGALRRGRVRMMVIGGVCDQLADLLETLDERAVDAAAVGAAKWFGNQLEREVVEDLYHCSLRVAKGRSGHEARLMVADSDNALNITDTMTLKLAGLLFLGAERFQWLWRMRLTSAEKPAAQQEPAPVPAPVTRASSMPVVASKAADKLASSSSSSSAAASLGLGVRSSSALATRPQLAFVDDDDDATAGDELIDDEYDDGYVGPDAEECQRMQEQLEAQLLQLEDAQRARAAQLRAAVDALRAADPTRRLAVMAEIDESLQSSSSSSSSS